MNTNSGEENMGAPGSKNGANGTNGQPAPHITIPKRRTPAAPAPDPVEQMRLEQMRHQTRQLELEVKLEEVRSLSKQKRVETFLNSPTVLDVIKHRARLCLTFIVSGLIFLILGASQVLAQLVGQQAIQGTFQNVNFSATGGGAILMLSSLLPFFFAYLARPTVRVTGDAMAIEDPSLVGRVRDRIFPGTKPPRPHPDEIGTVLNSGEPSRPDTERHRGLLPVLSEKTRGVLSTQPGGSLVHAT